MEAGILYIKIIKMADIGSYSMSIVSVMVGGPPSLKNIPKKDAKEKYKF